MFLPLNCQPQIPFLDTSTILILNASSSRPTRITTEQSLNKHDFNNTFHWYTQCSSAI